MHTRPSDVPERTVNERTVPSRFPNGKFGRRPSSGTDTPSETEEVPQVLLVGGSDERAGRRCRKRRGVRLSEYCPQEAGGFVRAFEDDVMESGTAAHAFTPRTASVQDGDSTDMPPSNAGAFAPASAVLAKVSRIHDACRSAEKSLEGRDLPKHGGAGVLE